MALFAQRNNFTYNKISSSPVAKFAFSNFSLQKFFPQRKLENMNVSTMQCESCPDFANSQQILLRKKKTFFDITQIALKIYKMYFLFAFDRQEFVLSKGLLKCQ